MIGEKVKQKRRSYIEYETYGNYSNGILGMRETGRKAKLIRKPNGEQIISFYGKGVVDKTKPTLSTFWSEPILNKRWL